ncbi:PD-(D/E)XK nuclease family protein [Kribbella sp. CA-247076]|uniref:PD-(D/E)XK nuclease family protein n=1 Tax=Kribbella sp. CA-247076 TaxID=3239941 RepID=UPI003D922606
MNQPSVGAGWLSPSRAWRLIECPASVQPVAGNGPGAATDQEVNTGTLAHRALERWIRAEGYRAGDPKAALAEAADACAAELPGGPPSSWRVSRARLVARGMSLVDLIGQRMPAQVLSEVKLQDDDLRLRGQLDLLLLGDDIVVVDLKTQTLLDEGLPEWVQFQLTLYAHLIEKIYGDLPARVEVFSLNRGRIDVPITKETLRDARGALAMARAANPSHAKPSREACQFCARRLECEPHWEVAMRWRNTDALEGAVVRVEEATTGVAAVLLEGLAGRAWASGIPTDLIAAATPGQMLRLVRVHHVGVGADRVALWRWRRLSAGGVGTLSE